MALGAPSSQDFMFAHHSITGSLKGRGAPSQAPWLPRRGYRAWTSPVEVSQAWEAGELGLLFGQGSAMAGLVAKAIPALTQIRRPRLLIRISWGTFKSDQWLGPQSHPDRADKDLWSSSLPKSTGSCCSRRASPSGPAARGGVE